MLSETLLRTLSNTTYYLAWLAAGLALVAVASAAITRHLRLRLLRRERAGQLLEALASYTGWISAQRRAAFFQGDAQEGDTPLQVVRTIQRDWFPELADEVAQLVEVHAHLIDFLWTQQMLRLKDPEAWFESDHDARFMQLWRSHRDALRSAAEKLKALAGADGPGMETESIFTADGAGTPGLREPGYRALPRAAPLTSALRAPAHRRGPLPGPATAGAKSARSIAG